MEPGRAARPHVETLAKTIVPQAIVEGVAHVELHRLDEGVADEEHRRPAGVRVIAVVVTADVVPASLHEELDRSLPLAGPEPRRASLVKGKIGDLVDVRARDRTGRHHRELCELGWREVRVERRLPTMFNGIH